MNSLLEKAMEDVLENYLETDELIKIYYEEDWEQVIDDHYYMISRWVDDQIEDVDSLKEMAEDLEVDESDYEDEDDFIQALVDKVEDFNSWYDIQNYYFGNAEDFVLEYINYNKAIDLVQGILEMEFETVRQYIDDSDISDAIVNVINSDPSEFTTKEIIETMEEFEIEPEDIENEDAKDIIDEYYKQVALEEEREEKQRAIEKEKKDRQDMIDKAKEYKKFLEELPEDIKQEVEKVDE